MPTFNGTRALLSYVQCLLYVISSSLNISIFHSVWLGTFWTDIKVFDQLGISPYVVGVTTYICVPSIFDSNSGSFLNNTAPITANYF